MRISELIKKLPPFGDYHKTVEDALVAFGAWLKFDSDAHEYLASSEIEEINTLVLILLKAYKYFQTGQIAECYKTSHDVILSNMFSYKIFNTYKTDVGYFLYRMRQSDNEYLFSKEELFHIPFQERQKVSNQRYSLTGYPCLYLGSSIYVCWEELNRPKFNNSNIVGLKTLRPLHLLDLRMPSNITCVEDFYRLPLIIASSVKVKEPSLPFKPEYIISQSILHAIVAHNNSFYSPENLNGIIYYSSKINSNQRLFYDLPLFENIIVPTVNNTQSEDAEKIYQSGFCPTLCNTFEITNPISFNTYELSKDIKTVFLYQENEISESYNSTQMGVLEVYIKQLSTHKISPNKFFRFNPDLLEKY